MNHVYEPGSSADPSLSESIVVRRRRRYGRKFIVSILVLVILFSALVSLRVMTMKFPVFSQSANVSDGWRTLRGVFNVNISQKHNADTVLSGLFDAGLDFAVINSSGELDLQDVAANAPLTIIPSQQLCSPKGCFSTFGMDRKIQANEAEAGDTFGRLRKMGGWSVIVGAMGGAHRWKAWDESTPDAFEFLNAEHHSDSEGASDLLTSFAGSVLGCSAGLDFLGVRPKSSLARWDDFLRKGRVLGVCGHDSSNNYGSPLTFVVVKDGLGPYGAKQVCSALIAGHFFCALPIYGDCSGFRFVARPIGGGTTMGTMGDEVDLRVGVELWAGLNLHKGSASKIYMVLYRDGVEVFTKDGESFSYRAKTAGVYRVEVVLRTCGLFYSDEERVFIYSNPIFITD